MRLMMKLLKKLAQLLRVRKSLEAIRALRASVQLRISYLLDRIHISPFLRFLFLANFLDALLTLKWIEMQVAEEANPLMAYLIEVQPEIFLAVKIASMTASCFILWRFRRLRAAKLLTIMAALLYVGVLVIHAVGPFVAGILIIPSLGEVREEAAEIWKLSKEWISNHISML